MLQLFVFEGRSVPSYSQLRRMPHREAVAVEMNLGPLPGHHQGDRLREWRPYAARLGRLHPSIPSTWLKS